MIQAKEVNTLFTQEERDYLHVKKSITFCSDPNWEPYSHMNEEGEHEGLVEDLLRSIEKKIGIKLQFIPTKSWHESLDFVQMGKCEFIAILNETSQRARYLNFTPALYKEPEVIVIRNEIPYLNGIKQLFGKNMALIKGHQSEVIIKKYYPQIKIKYVKNYEEAMKLVADKEAFATLNSLLGTIYLMKKLELDDIKIAFKTDYINEYKIGVTKNDVLLHSILSKAITSLDKIQKDEIIDSWITVDVEQRFNFVYFRNALIILFFVGLLVFFRHQDIKKQNKKLRKEIEEELEKSRDKDRLIFHQNKLVSMGEMIENIAHQWRQPLSEINSLVLTLDDDLYRKEALDKNIETQLKQIEVLTKYMSHTISDFRNFFNPQKSKELFFIYEAIDSTLHIVQKHIERSGITLDIKCPKDISYMGFKSELQQVLLILFNNARDILVERDIQNAKIFLEVKKSKSIYSINFYDNGGGIYENIIDKIFTPYFTTKVEGTGLGLYIAKNIIEKNMNGTLEIFNNKQGACFLITLQEE